VSTPLTWAPSYHVVPAWHDPITLLAGVASPEDAEDALRLALATGATTALSADAYATLPYQDRLAGPGSGRIMACFVYPATAARFTDGTQAGTYFAAGDLDTALHETRHHLAAGIEASLAAARHPAVTAEMQVVEALLMGVFDDVRARRATRPDIYDRADYQPSQRYGAAVRLQNVDGIVYQSVRNPPSGECAAVFRPRALRDAQDGARFLYEWTGAGQPVRVTPIP
jgi:hypothetical protein